MKSKPKARKNGPKYKLAHAPLNSRAIESDAVYTCAEAAFLISMHPRVLSQKLQCGLIPGSRMLGTWRVRGIELLKTA